MVIKQYCQFVIFSFINIFLLVCYFFDLWTLVTRRISYLAVLWQYLMNFAFTVILLFVGLALPYITWGISLERWLNLIPLSWQITADINQSLIDWSSATSIACYNKVSNGLCGSPISSRCHISSSAVLPNGCLDSSSWHWKHKKHTQNT